LAQNYSKTIKKLCLSLGTFELRGIKLREALAQSSSFEFLENLDLVIQSHSLPIVSIDNSLSMIAKNCLKLQRLHFSSSNSSIAYHLIKAEIFPLFSLFKNLIELKLYYKRFIWNCGPIESFKSMKYLERLEVSVLDSDHYKSEFTNTISI
jgi:hypothetical protein